MNLPKKLQAIRENGFATREKGYWGRAIDYGGIVSAISIAIHADNQAVGAISLVWRAEKQSVASVAKAHKAHLARAANAIGKKLSSGGGDNHHTI